MVLRSDAWEPRRGFVQEESGRPKTWERAENRSVTPRDRQQDRGSLWTNAERRGVRRRHHHRNAGAAPQLATIRRDGRTRDVVVVASKATWLYVFDRVTGEPIWPIEERPVPKSDMPGEQSWPTQPYPSNPPPFARQSSMTTW